MSKLLTVLFGVWILAISGIPSAMAWAQARYTLYIHNYATPDGVAEDLTLTLGGTSQGSRLLTSEKSIVIKPGQSSKIMFEWDVHWSSLDTGNKISFVITAPHFKDTCRLVLQGRYNVGWPFIEASIEGPGEKYLQLVAYPQGEWEEASLHDPNHPQNPKECWSNTGLEDCQTVQQLHTWTKHRHVSFPHNDYRVYAYRWYCGQQTNFWGENFDYGIINLYQTAPNWPQEPPKW